MSEPGPVDPVDEDILVACADLVDRAGGMHFELGHVHDDVPPEEAGWYAHATYQGARIIVDDQRSPAAAALGLAERILTGGQCKCGRISTVTQTDSRTRCRWQRVGQRWESGCDAYGVDLPASMRGNLRGLAASLAASAPTNRAARRAQQRQSRRRG